MRIILDFDSQEAFFRYLESMNKNGLFRIENGKPVSDSAKITIKHSKKKISEKDLRNQNPVLFEPESDVGIVFSSIYLANNNIAPTPKNSQFDDISSNKLKSPVAQVRDCWLESYAHRYGRLKRCPWGAREGGQAANLLGSLPLADCLELIPQYFKWPNARVIRAGHPFGIGPDSFIMKYIELSADLVAPERHAEAASIDSRMREASKDASMQSVVDEVIRGYEREKKALED